MKLLVNVLGLACVAMAIGWMMGRRAAAYVLHQGGRNAGVSRARTIRYAGRGSLPGEVFSSSNSTGGSKMSFAINAAQ
jgi:hypothetical protein